MVGCVAAFMECCYIARRNAITSADLEEFGRQQARFQDLREIFIETGVRSSISLPRQHALLHYVSKIELFASPNGTCSSITECKHIKAVKEPWRRSNRFNALPQMVKTISRLDKLAALRRVFADRAMLKGTLFQYASAIIAGSSPQVLPYGASDGNANANNNNGDGNDSDGGPLAGPKMLAQVTLAATQGKYKHLMSRLSLPTHNS